MKKIYLLLVPVFLFFISFANAAYTSEEKSAYTWAFNNWITSMSTIDKADMKWEVSRIALAKMISNYAVKTLKKKGDSSKKCVFTDVTSDLDKQYDKWVTTACQLWLMWQWITKFRPYDKVTRAEFWTILSRLLYWNKFDWWNPYYIKHLVQLNSLWIMWSISNANMKNESRGNVMIMLKRSKEWWIIRVTPFNDLSDVVQSNCTVIDISDDYSLGWFAPSFFPYKSIPRDTVYKRSYILPFNDGYIWYDYISDDAYRFYYLTYKTVDNPCKEISRTKDIFAWHNDYQYAKTQWHSDYHPDNEVYKTVGQWVSDSDHPIKILECDKWNWNWSNRTCQKKLDKYMYDLIVWNEWNDYFNKIMQQFKEDIVNNNFKDYVYWSDKMNKCRNVDYMSRYNKLNWKPFNYQIPHDEYDTYRSYADKWEDECIGF